MKLHKKKRLASILSKPLVSFVDVIFFAFLAELDHHHHLVHISRLALLTFQMKEKVMARQEEFGVLYREISQQRINRERFAFLGILECLTSNMTSILLFGK